MGTPKKKQKQEKKARQRADIIMKVRSGIMTATEGAAALGVSRKTYYKWENRALGAMLDGLENRDTGRPELLESSQDEVALKKKLKELQKQNELLEQKMVLAGMVYQFELEKAKEQSQKGKKTSAKKKKKGAGKS